jgi:hypothetical protein
MNDPAITDIKVTLARMEALNEGVAHRLKNMDMKFDALDVKVDHLPSAKDFLAVERRVAEIERNQSWLIRGVLAGVGAAGGALYYIGGKLGVG